MKKINQLLQLVLGSRGLRLSIFTMGGDIVSAGFSAIALILFSRILGPTSFGEFSIGFAVVLILSRVADAGFTAATLKYAASAQDNKQANQVFSIAIFYKLIITLVVATVCLLLRNQIASIFDFHNQQIIILSFTLGASVVFYEQLLVMLQSVHYFTQAVLINLIQSIMKTIGAVVLLITKSTSSSVAFGIYVTAPLIPVLFSKLLLPKWFSFERVMPVPLQLKIFGMVKHSSVAFISAGIIENIDVLFVQKYLSSYETGLYSGVSRIAMLFSLFAFSLANVLNPRVARYKTKADRLSFVKKAIGINVLAVVGFLCFLPFARLLIYLTIGPEYVTAINELIILTASSFLLIAAIPWIAMFYSFKSNWYFSVSGIIQLVLVVVGNILFVRTFGLQATAWVRLVTRLFVYLFSVSLALWFFYGEHRTDTIEA